MKVDNLGDQSIFLSLLACLFAAIATVPPTLPAVPAGLPPRGYPLPGTYGGGLSPNQVTGSEQINRHHIIAS